jgi:hypothetical protein
MRTWGRGPQDKARGGPQEGCFPGGRGKDSGGVEILSLSKLYDLVSFVMWFFYHNSNSYMKVVLDFSFNPNYAKCFFFFNQTLASRLLSPSTLFPPPPLLPSGAFQVKKFYLKILLSSD